MTPAPRDLMTPFEVRQMLKVDPKTVWQWGTDGLIASIRTPGGHRRYHRADVEAMLDGSRTRRQVTRDFT